MTCYQFSSGPFKRLWIKVGVDPRFNAAHALDQTVTAGYRGVGFRGRRRRAKRKERFTLSSRSDREYHDATHAFRTVPDVRHPALFLRDVALPRFAPTRSRMRLRRPPRATSASVIHLGRLSQDSARHPPRLPDPDERRRPHRHRRGRDGRRRRRPIRGRRRSLAPTIRCRRRRQYRILGPDASDADSDSDDAYDE